MESKNTRAMAELEELKKYAKKRKLHWEQSKKDRKELSLKNMANARAVQCHDFIFEINERLEKLKNESSVLPIFSVVGSTCLSLSCDKTMNNKWCGYAEKCKYQRYNKEDGLFECQLFD